MPVTRDSSSPLEGLSGNLWPLHVKPRPDELLSSWVIRFAHAHRLKVEHFCTCLLGRYSPSWNRDVDRLAPLALLAMMARVSGTPLARVEQTTLAAYGGWLSEEVNPLGNSRWMLPLGIFHRARRRAGLMYCPACFGDGDGGYYRRTWRLAWATVCCRHHNYLLEACPHCGAPIAPHRTDMGGRALIPNRTLITTCYACGFRLARGDLVEAPASLVAFQATLEGALADGFVAWAGNPGLHSVLFFDGLRALSAVIVRQARRHARGPAPVRDIEHLPLAQRAVLLLALAELTTAWPDRLLACVKAQGLRFTDLHVFERGLPYWYWAAIRPLANISAPVTQEQVSSLWRLALRLGVVSLEDAPPAPGQRAVRLLRAKCLQVLEARQRDNAIK